jgi:hypothetical protein
MGAAAPYLGRAPVGGAPHRYASSPLSGMPQYARAIAITRSE